MQVGGDSTELICSSVNPPVWLFNDKEIQHTNVDTGTKGENNNWLKITNAQKENSGHYTCVAENDQLIEEDTAYIKVIGIFSSFSP